MKNMEIKIKFKPNPEYRLMDQVYEVLRYYHYAYRTEQSYGSGILQYIKFYGGKTHPKDMGKNEVERFLSFLAEKKNVAAAGTLIYRIDNDIQNGLPQHAAGNQTQARLNYIILKTVLIADYSALFVYYFCSKFFCFFE